MKSRSIKKSLPQLTKLMVALFLVLILPANLYLQNYLNHRSQMENTVEMFAQVEHLMKLNKLDRQIAEKDFKNKCIQAVKLAAYFVERDPEILNDEEEIRQFKVKLNVDELHFYTPEGIMFAGTNPNYYGLSLKTDEKMKFFEPVLENKDKCYCQDAITSKTRSIDMQYAAIWTADKSCIVQIGMDTWRFTQEVRDKNIQSIITDMPFELSGYLHIVDRKNCKVLASTSLNLVGKDMSGVRDNIGDCSDIHEFHQNYEGNSYCVYTKCIDDYILVRSYSSSNIVEKRWTSTILVFAYIVLVTAGVIGIIRWFLNRKFTGNLWRIITELKKMEEGEIERIKVKTGITEFDELLFYINRMLENIRSNWTKLTNIIEKGKMPIGILEKNLFYHKSFVNDKMVEILGLKKEGLSQHQLLKQVEEKLLLLEQHMVDPEESIYEYDLNGKSRYLRMEKEEEESSITYFVTDISLLWGEIYDLREQSNIDLLTGLYNRRGFQSKVDEIFLSVAQMRYAVLVIADADGLKAINDIYGHQAGDEYLQKIADVLKMSENDKVICARLGGDEFAVFCYDLDSEKEVENIVNKVRDKRDKEYYFQQMNQTALLQFSVGTAVYPLDGEKISELMGVADERMYQEKQERKRR